jgi:uncharacterized protein YdeI (YjbR/CyaY-like superfamily)
MSRSADDKPQPRFFATPEALRKWMHANHEKKSEQWIGFYKTNSGKPSITWPEAVDEALCVGWIDGVRKSLGEDSYMIRFTPRKATSTWSAVNQRRMAVLTAENRVLPAGLAAFEQRKEGKSGIYAYENRKSATLTPEYEKRFRANKKAWKYFSEQPPSYKYTIIWWIITGKQEATRERRLAEMIQYSEKGVWHPRMKWATSTTGKKRAT